MVCAGMLLVGADGVHNGGSILQGLLAGGNSHLQLGQLAHNLIRHVGDIVGNGIDFAGGFKCEPKKLEIIAGGASAAPKRCEFAADIMLAFRSPL